MQVRSETDSLEVVIIHEPDMGIGYISPEIAEQLLYDDIVFLPRMIEEHSVFTEALRVLIGKRHVYEFQMLLEEVLNQKEVVMELLQRMALVEKVPANLFAMPPKNLAFTLVTGLDSETKTSCIKPLPNLVFTRDLACVIHDHIVISKMQRPARWRESLLMQCVVRHHPLFQSFCGKVIDLSAEDYFSEDSEITLEGGDVMLVHEDYLLIGISERTSAKGAELLKEHLLERNVVKNVVTVSLPAERYCMHLDTVFTCVDKTTCIGFAPLVFESHEKVEIRRYLGKDAGVVTYSSLKDLMEEIFPGILCIPCGAGVEPFASREQWTDACNLVTVKPGVAFSYERNIYTLQAFKESGFRLIDGRHLIVEQQKSSTEQYQSEKEIITIPSAELSRARGGTHCMTLPISRTA